jgi:hypothetical protein
MDREKAYEAFRAMLRSDPCITSAEGNLNGIRGYNRKTSDPLTNLSQCYEPPLT